MKKEANITINDVELTNAQSMALRVALNSLAAEMQRPSAFGDDDCGIAIARGYRDRCGEILKIIESGGASPWRPMADAPKDGPFLAKLRDDWTVTVDGEVQLSDWAGRMIVARMRRGDVGLDAPVDCHWIFVPDDVEGWMPLLGGKDQSRCTEA